MFRACELKDQTYKKTRTLHFSELCGFPEHKNAGKYEYIGMCMCENGIICPFFFSTFGIFRVKIGIFFF